MVFNCSTCFSAAPSGTIPKEYGKEGKAMANFNKQAKKAEAPSSKTSNPSTDKQNAKKGK